MSESTEKTSPLRIFGQPKMAVLLFLGFSSGLPFYLTSKTLQAWMTTAKVDLATIGFFSLVTLPYSLKFVWAPLMDRYVPPFLGRRRGWVFITQVLLLLAIAAMSLHDPRTGLKMLAINAIAIAFFSASQDISLDAYRTDVLRDREMGAGAAVFVMGYRIAMITTGALAFFLADRLPWPMVYLILSILMIVGIVTTFVAPEPVLNDAPPRTLVEAVVLPFADFFQRVGVLRALLVLLFIVAYKYSDSLAGSMTTPFLLQAGFSQSEVGAVFLGVGKEPRIHGGCHHHGELRSRSRYRGNDCLFDEYVQQALYRHSVRAALEPNGRKQGHTRRSGRKICGISGVAGILSPDGRDGYSAAAAATLHRTVVARCSDRRGGSHR